ncbi:MAG: flagellar basal body-associated FliL family protein [Hyphomicrobiales bacterium]
MAKDEDLEVEGEEGEGGEESGKKGFGLKKILLFVVLPLVVLGGGGGGAAWWFGLFGGGDAAVVEQGPAPKPAVFYDLPEMTVNLVSASSRDQYLRLKVSLELADNDTIGLIEPNLPRVLDAFQVYLRELRTTDFEGSAGLFRLKEELQRRINIAVYPAKVDGILFREIIVQ